MEVNIVDLDEERVARLGPDTAFAAHLRFCKDVGQTTTTISPQEWFMYSLVDQKTLSEISDAVCVSNEAMESILVANLAHYIKNDKFAIQLCVQYKLYDELARRVAGQHMFIYDIIPIKRLIEQCYIDADGNTPFLFYCEQLRYSTALALLDSPHSHPEHVNNKGFTALLMICKYFQTWDIEGRNELITKILETGNANVNHCGPDGKSAMHILLDYDWKMALQLAKYGGDIYATNKDNQTLLHLLMYDSEMHKEDMKLVEEIVAMYGNNLSAVDKYNQTPLMYACYSDSDANLVKFFFREGLTARDIGLSHVDSEGLTPFMLACNRGLLVLAKHMLYFGDVNIGQVNSDDGTTALINLCSRPMKYTEEFALEILNMYPDTCNYQQVSRYSTSLLECAKIYEFPKIVEWIHSRQKLKLSY